MRLSQEKQNSKVETQRYIDKELIHIKNFRPDIVKSWKYYQEFEKFFS
ncbi:DUF2972 domain-containing protein [Campylobacter lari subsp. concheus]|nr:DUF2972 domain-containing protein [Campylobacter lari subsp. concheus]MPC01164.1 DUF2972 domain-containing protein [Campylobacter lari]